MYLINTDFNSVLGTPPPLPNNLILNAPDLPCRTQESEELRAKKVSFIKPRQCRIGAVFSSDKNDPDKLCSTQNTDTTIGPQQYKILLPNPCIRLHKFKPLVAMP